MRSEADHLSQDKFLDCFFKAMLVELLGHLLDKLMTLFVKSLYFRLKLKTFLMTLRGE